jgi:environmental stress-induced protein Ves
MPALQTIPRVAQLDETWANGAGTTTVILREPDHADWILRISVAQVDLDGPFSDLPGTHRTLVPLDAPITLRFPDGRELSSARFGTLSFDGSPAPTGVLPEGPTRDFNLMLRGGTRGEVLPRTLVDAMVLPPEPGVRWLVYLDSGHATLRAGAGAEVTLNPRDAALVRADDHAARTMIEGAGEIVLVKLYA